MANLIEWNDDKFSVKIKTIDNQHKRLVDLINELYEAMTKGEAHSKLSSILEELIQYTASHFKTEDLFFEKFGYQDSPEHILEHKAFVTKVLTFQKDFEAGNVTISKDILLFLKKWLTEHIGESDMKYAQFLIQNGVE